MRPFFPGVTPQSGTENWKEVKVAGREVVFVSSPFKSSNSELEYWWNSPQVGAVEVSGRGHTCREGRQAPAPRGSMAA